jgi:hypothetical protein
VKNLIAAVAATLLMVSGFSLAGVAPNSTSSAASQSGAKIAPPKPATDAKQEQQGEAKEPAK